MSIKPGRTSNGEPAMGGNVSEIRDLFGGPTAVSWREQALTRVAELENLAAAFEGPELARPVLVQRIGRHLDTARQAADGKQPKRALWTRFKAFVGGSALERT